MRHQDQAFDASLRLNAQIQRCTGVALGPMATLRSGKVATASTRADDDGSASRPDEGIEAVVPSPLAPSLFASARLFVLLQLGSRLCTFTLNQFLVRLTSPEVFGAATIQFELLLGLVLTAAREGVRCVALRQGQEKDNATASDSENKRKEASRRVGRLSAEQQAAHNLSFVAGTVGLIVDVVLSYLYISRASSTLRASPFFAPAVTLFALGGALELLSEPLFNRAQVLGDVGLRVRAEGLAVLANCLIVLVCMIKPQLFGIDSRKAESYGLMAYGWGRVAMGATFLGVYMLSFARRQGLNNLKALLWPKKVALDGQNFYLAPSGMSLSWAMGKQAMLKHIMGESDKFAVARLGTLEDQGGYALASNYGSLVLRILFNPVEEAARIALSKSLGHVLSGEDGKVSAAESEAPNGEKRDTATGGNDISNEVALRNATDMLAGIFRLHILLGLFFITFGPPLALSAIYLLAGSRWACTTSAPAILGAYACYIPVLGLNGIGEAFLTATAGPKQLGRHNIIIITSSAVFVVALWAFQRFPNMSETQLVWSSTLSVGLRAGYAWWYALWFLQHASKSSSSDDSTAQARWDREILPLNILPSAPVLTTFAISAYLLRYVFRIPHQSDSCPASIREIVPNVGISAVIALVCLVAW